MSCSSPVKIKNKNTNRVMEVSCNNCISCRVTRQSQLTFLCEKELDYLYKEGLSAAYVTLTYNNAYVPLNDNGATVLRKRDLQLFLKRFRILLQRDGIDQRIKYVASGELGGKTHRPHFHLAIFGLPASVVNKYVARAWSVSRSRSTYTGRIAGKDKYIPLGYTSVKTLSIGGVRYITKYITKSSSFRQLKQVYDDNDLVAPFVVHSVGIGKRFIIDNAQKIASDGFTFRQNGVVRLYPKYVREWVHHLTGIDPRPYITRYIHSSVVPAARTLGLDVNDYTLWRAQLYERNYINTCRQMQTATFSPEYYQRNFWPDVQHKKRINLIEKYKKYLTNI